MRRKIFPSIAILSFLIGMLACSRAADSGSGAAGPVVNKGATRSPAVDGTFYPAEKRVLGTMIDQFLAKARLPEVEGVIKAMIVPHAGYQYSGQVAAYGYKELVGQRFDTVIIIGNSHRERFDGISVFPAGIYETPLGGVPVDSELAGELMAADPRIFYQESAHIAEHSIEVQLPFLQKVLEGFKIVPILFGNASKSDCRILAKAISEKTRGKNVLLIASSDLSHYPPYDAAKKADARTVDAILTGDVSTLEGAIAGLERERIPNAATFACGEDAIKTVMLAAKGMGATAIRLLNAANSGDVSGDKSRVVGYAAIGFFAKSGFGRSEQEELLKIARFSVESIVNKTPMPKMQTKDPLLNQKLGAFVTIKKHGELRGCVGRFSPTDIPLYQVVSQMAMAAATEDVRFRPVEPKELREIDYEISVLSVPERISGWKDVVLGRDGVIVEKGGRRGVFLPQVATEHHMTIGEFLGSLCSHKVGLPADCYKDPSVKLYVFTADVFGGK